MLRLNQASRQVDVRLLGEPKLSVEPTLRITQVLALARDIGGNIGSLCVADCFEVI